MTKVPADLMVQACRWRTIMKQPIGTTDEKTLCLQRNLLTEEYEEFIQAHTELLAYPNSLDAKEHMLKELADLVFTCFQYAAAAGFELDEAMDRVYESNLSKLVDGEPVKRADGKVIKGPHYHHPYLTDLV